MVEARWTGGFDGPVVRAGVPAGVDEPRVWFHRGLQRAYSTVEPMHPSLNRLAASATTHCLTGCAIGEVLGLVLATALGWGTAAAIVLAIALAFVFGYALTLRPLLAAGLGLGAALRLALAADTVSIAVMEVVDNAIMLVIPGAMEPASATGASGAAWRWPSRSPGSPPSR